MRGLSKGISKETAPSFFGVQSSPTKNFLSCTNKYWGKVASLVRFNPTVLLFTAVLNQSGTSSVRAQDSMHARSGTRGRTAGSSLRAELLKNKITKKRQHSSRL